MLSKRVIFIVLMLLAIVLGGGLYILYRTSTGSAPKMNVLLVTLDTTRADRLGCYGYTKPTSPNLDKLAAESVQFDMAIAQAAVTPVSHASILTGLNPYHHGLRVFHGTEDNTLTGKHRTLAEVWRKTGGQTAAFVSAFPVTAAFGFDQGFAHFDAQFQQSDGKGLIEPDGLVNVGKSQRKADETTEAALKWLGKKVEPDKPLFMWVHYFDPHDPLVLPSQEFLNKFTPPSNTQKSLFLTIYDAEVTYMDYYIGRLFDGLKEQGMWDDTMVVVVGDHGEGLGDHDWWTHGILYQEQIRVPMIIRVPGIKKGSHVSSLVRTIDLMPTILETVGISAGRWPDMDGETLTAAMRTGRTKKQRIAYSDSVNMLNYARLDSRYRRDYKSDKLYCLMTETDKLIYHQLKPHMTEFYNLRNDPLEAIDLAGSKPAAMKVLLEQLAGLKAFSDIAPSGDSTDPERTKRLKSLGYVQ